MRTLLDVLEENIDNCFDSTGEWEPDSHVQHEAMKWVLTEYEYPEEVWEGRDISRAIAKASATADLDDAQTAFGLIRREATRIARELMEPHRGKIEQTYRDMGRPEHDDPYGLKRDIWNHTISMISKA